MLSYRSAKTGVEIYIGRRRLGGRRVTIITFDQDDVFHSWSAIPPAT
jgi:hypothetical protein